MKTEKQRDKAKRRKTHAFDERGRTLSRCIIPVRALLLIVQTSEYGNGESVPKSRFSYRRQEMDAKKQNV